MEGDVPKGKQTTSSGLAIAQPVRLAASRASNATVFMAGDLEIKYDESEIAEGMPKGDGGCCNNENDMTYDYMTDDPIVREDPKRDVKGDLSELASLASDFAEGFAAAAADVSSAIGANMDTSELVEKIIDNVKNPFVDCFPQTTRKAGKQVFVSDDLESSAPVSVFEPQRREDME